ncbi:NAD(P)-dependent oxidoreductase [Streptomyces huiliensis]|uniref:NAD(P)-dependent oxidoreductase n=1 Tax=Streptomyces huiliensis TaxID=2876027 RepID=UPI001CBFCC63|nr:NAD(P)-binding domain-containing protein [Streptomyces huiliensis]MBZ4318245.1 NAD(P)-binding domain-containing protein [Streptomyces huiliensis]
MDTAVSVIGLGAMGTALAGAFLAAGHPTTVWNRTRAKALPLVGKGAVEAASPGAAAGASPLVVVCLSTYGVVREVLEPCAAALPGRTLVNLASGSPVHAREAAGLARERGLDYLDGAVLTTPSGVGRPDALLLYGGPRPAFDAHRDVLAALGDPVYLGDDPALAAVHDAALLGLLWSTLTGWLHGVALTGADGPGGGVPATAYTAVAGRWMATVGRLMEAHARQIDAGEYPAEEFPLDLHLRLMGLLAHAGELRGVESGLPEVFLGLAGRAVADGHGVDGFARLIEYVRGPAGP